jgi:stage II sporulation protein D
MKIKNRKTDFAIAVALAVVLVLSGCSSNQTPQQKPAPDQTTPQQQTVQETEPDITVYMHETGQKKTMKMEEYIAGVVAGEMKADWPLEALAAQAIIARTFTIQAIEEKGGVPERGAMASTDIKEFQAYDEKAVNDNVKRAVEMTRGLVATYQGQPIKAWFHASAGGITAMAKEGLNYKYDEPPYVQSVPSPDDLAPADVQNWTATFSKKNITDALAKQGNNITNIDSFAIGSKGPSGRATTFIINENTEVSAPELRVSLDSTKLKSTLLDKVEVSGDNVIFTGKGYGHGVGMSQWGANKMAKEGKKPEDIVTYYFKGITIEKRWQ